MITVTGEGWGVRWNGGERGGQMSDGEKGGRREGERGGRKEGRGKEREGRKEEGRRERGKERNEITQHSSTASITAGV